MSTETKILRVVAEILETPERQIRPSDDFISDLGVTSLDIVSLVWRIEDVFDLEEIPESALEQINTVADLIALVMEQKQENKPADIAPYDLVLASDHAGLGLKNELVAWSKKNGYRILDLGPNDLKPVDYPDYAQALGQKIVNQEARFGILTCGSGIGMSIAANKVRGLRAAMVSEPVSAALSRQHNDANVLCLGARMIGTEMAIQCLQAFLKTPFEPGDDGRHQRRIQGITQIETVQPETRAANPPSTPSSLLSRPFRR